VAGAITAVRLDSGTAQRWFELIDTVHTAQRDSGAADDWDGFRQQFENTAGGESFGSDQIQDLLRYLDDNGRLDTVRQMRELGSELPVHYEQLTAARDATGFDDAAGPDDAYGAVVGQGPSGWDTVVEQFGPGWAGWDGSEQGWQQFRDWTYGGANGIDPKLYEAAYERLDPLNARSLAERIGELTAFGFTINAAPPAPEDPWAGVVDRYGPSWAGWDGSEQGWQQFRDWTYSVTNAEDPQLYATTYERLDPLNALGTAERIARLTELGFTVAATAPQQPVDTATQAVVDEVVAPAMDELLASLNEYAAQQNTSLAELMTAGGITAAQLSEILVEEMANEAAAG
jgi:hypothetical protein